MRNRRAQFDALHRRQYLGRIRRQRLIQPSSNPESFNAIDHCFACLGAVGLQYESPAELQAVGAVEPGSLFVITLRQHILELTPYFAIPVFPDDVEMLAARSR